MLLLLSLSACTNSGLGRTDDATTTSTTPVPTCPWVGVYDLDEVFCSSFPFDPWFDDHDVAVLRIAQNDTVGWCDVEVELVGPDCLERELMRLVGADDGTDDVAVTYRGIAECDPAACVFGSGDDSCILGAGEGETDAFELTVDADGALELTDEQPDGAFVRNAPDCTLKVVTRWIPR
ncbi:MAG: hypothetical protein KTR31_14010 [Myxococcales bacterium]|nr:hypothetical protein [Myxococcales bacterium]